MAPQILPDFSEAVKPTPKIPGTYICKILSSELKYGKESGAPYINWKLGAGAEAQTVFYSTPIQGKGAGMFKHFVHSAGDPSYDSGPYNTDALTGHFVSMKLIVDGNGYFQVKDVTSLTPIQMEAVKDQQPSKYDLPQTEDIPF